MLAAAGSPEALGVALVALHADNMTQGRRLYEEGYIGILDAVEGRWIVLPWPRPELPLTYVATNTTGGA